MHRPGLADLTGFARPTRGRTCGWDRTSALPRYEQGALSSLATQALDAQADGSYLCLGSHRGRWMNDHR